MTRGPEASAVAERLRTEAKKSRETPAGLRSRRYTVSEARDASEKLTASLESLWHLYHEELERPVSTADEFAQIDQYSIDIRKSCSELVQSIAESHPETVGDHLQPLNRALQAESADSIATTLLRTLKRLLKDGVLYGDAARNFVEPVLSTGQRFDSTNVRTKVIDVLGQFADLRNATRVQRQAAEALSTLAESYGGQQRMYALGRYGLIGAKNGYASITADAVDRILSEMESPKPIDQELRKPLENMDKAVTDTIDDNSIEPAEGMYLLETILYGGGALDPELIQPIVEAGVGLENRERYGDVADFASSAAFDLTGLARHGGLMELRTLGEETNRTAIKRKAVFGLNSLGQESTKAHLQVYAYWGIARLAEDIEDQTLCEDLVSELETRVAEGNYLLRSAAADAIGETVAGSGSRELARDALDTLQTQLLPGRGQSLHSAREPILNIAISSSDPQIQALVLGTVRAIVKTETESAVEILREFPNLLRSLDTDLKPEAVDVIATGIRNDYSHIRAATVNGIPGDWLASEPDEVQSQIFRELHYASQATDGDPVTHQTILQTCHEYLEETHGEDRLGWAQSLFSTLLEADNPVIKIFGAGSLARLGTEEAKETLELAIEQNEKFVKIGLEWGVNNLALDPPGSDTTAKDVLVVLNLITGDNSDRAALIVKSKLRTEMDSTAERTTKLEDDLPALVREALNQEGLELRRELLDDISAYADEFSQETRSELIPALKPGITAENGAIGREAVSVIKDLCTATDEVTVWKTATCYLDPDIETGSVIVDDAMAQSLSSMATEIPTGGPDAEIQATLFTLLPYCTSTGVIAALEGLAALDVDRTVISRHRRSITTAQQELLESAPNSGLSDSGRTLVTEFLGQCPSAAQINL